MLISVGHFGHNTTLVVSGDPPLMFDILVILQYKPHPLLLTGEGEKGEAVHLIHTCKH